MPRRLLRFGLSALCLLSLLACMAMAWLWWRGTRGREAVLEVAVLHADVGATSNSKGLAVYAYRHWRGKTGTWAGAGPDAPSTHFARLYQGQHANVAGIALESGLAWEYLTPDLTHGPPEEEGVCRLRTIQLIGPMPYWQASRIPHWLGPGAFAVLPILWLARRTRQALVPRRRRRLGLCPHCGYDLTGNTSGRCSECGQPIHQRSREAAA